MHVRSPVIPFLSSSSGSQPGSPILKGGARTSVAMAAVREGSGVMSDRLRLLRASTLWLVPMALKAVVDLGVHRIMAKAGVGQFLALEEIAADVANSTGFTVATIGRFLRLLTAYGLFDEAVKVSEEGNVERKYALNSTSWLLIGDEEGLSLESLVQFHTDFSSVTCGQHLAESAVDGEPPFFKAHGTDVWTYGSQNPRFDALFNKLMASASKIEVGDFLKRYDGFKDYKGTLVDVAGGYGQTIRMIVEAHPHLKGINFDQPHIIANAPAFPGVENVAGDMFESVPSGDAIFLKWILHDWSDKDCARILKNVRKALPPHGKLMIVDAVLPTETSDDAELQSQLHLDMSMMTVNVNGRERSEAEFRKLVLDAGFSSIKIVHPGGRIFGGCIFVALEALV